MLEDFEVIWHEGANYGFYRREKLSNGQVIGIYFLRRASNHNVEYSTVLAIGKKKHINSLIFGDGEALLDKTTGKCGLEGLVWAKRRLIEFEKFLQERLRYAGRNKDIPTYICVYGTDKRRRTLYARRLRDIGYEEQRRHGEHCVCKRVETPPPNARQRLLNKSRSH